VDKSGGLSVIIPKIITMVLKNTAQNS
jgi:hypothetical protein